MSAASASTLTITPGESFTDLLNHAGRQTLSAVLSEGGRERLVSAPILPGGRTALVGLTRSSRGAAARALVTFWRPEIGAALQNTFRLSDAEIVIARYLFEGLRPKTIADLRDRSPETVRSQIKAILQKTGATSALDLTHLIYGLNAHASVNAPAPGLGHCGEARLWQGPDWPIDIYCDGVPDGAPLVFLHGCLGGRVFAAEARAALQNRLIIAPGRAGHGRTPATGAAPAQAPDLTARHVLSVLDGFGIGQADLVAYDIGAASALKLASMAPERIKSVLVIGCLPPMPHMSDIMTLPRQQRVFPLLSRISTGAGKALANLGGERLLAGGPDIFGSVVFAGCDVDMAACTQAEVADLYWRGHGWHTIQGPEGFFLDAALAASAWDLDLQTLPMPVTFLHGTEDASAPIDRVECLARRVGGKMVPVARAGHSLLHDRPRRWTDLLT